jgi:hypothetical protein
MILPYVDMKLAWPIVRGLIGRPQLPRNRSTVGWTARSLLYWVAGFVACLLLGQPAYAIAVAVMFFIDTALLITFRRMLRQAQDPTPSRSRVV